MDSNELENYSDSGEVLASASLVGDEVLTQAEAEFVNALQGETTELTLATEICGDMDDAWEQLNLCLSVHRKAEKTTMKLRYIIGKLLVWASNNPAFYERKGFRTFEKFLTEHVCGLMALRRTVLRDAQRVMTKLPTLSPSDFQDLGVTKANILASHTSSSDSDFPRLLTTAKNPEVTAKGLEELLVQKNLTEAGEHQTDVIMIRCNKRVYDTWAKFSRDPEVVSYVGADDVGRILDSLIMEANGSWFSPNGFRHTCPHCKAEFTS